MAAPTPAEDAVEREFDTLARKLRFARGFGLVVLFVPDGRASLQLRGRLAAWLEAEDRTLVAIAPVASAKLVSQGLSDLFEAAAQAQRTGARIVVWLEAVRGLGDPGWDDQRRLLLNRMNERRSRLESELAAPLLLLLPDGAQRDAAMLAPDLWHIRLHSAALAMPDDRPIAGEPSSGRPLSQQEHSSSRGRAATPGLPLRWESEFSRALADGDGGGLDSLPFHDGLAAAEALRRQGQVARAAELASTLAILARRRLDRAVASDHDGALLDLATALRLQGEALARIGRRDEAIGVLTEGVERLRQPAGRDGRMAAALRTLLSSLGNVQRDAGAWRGAIDSYAEAVQLAGDEHRATLSSDADGVDIDTLAVLADLLGHLGDALSTGQPDEAIVNYEASVSSWRRALSPSRHDDRIVRSLASALVRLGHARWTRRQGERALRDYREALGLLRRVQERSPEEADGLDVLCRLLVTIGHVEQESGRVDAALAAYDEGLSTARRLLDSHGHEDAATVIRQLAMPLQRIAVARELTPSVEPPGAGRDAIAAAGADALRTRELTGALHVALGRALGDPSCSRALLDAASALVAHLRGGPVGTKMGTD